MKIKFVNLNKTLIKRKKIYSTFDNLIKKNQIMGGKFLENFEKKISSYFKIKHCISVANGTDALEIAIESLNLKKNSEIIVPANTWISAASAVIRQNYNLIFCDIDLDDYNMNIEDLKKKITKNTSAIIIVHLYGKAAKIKEISKLAKKKGIKIIEDCAQSTGTTIKKKHVGTFGEIGTVSFYPTKNLGAFGDGGCILTNSDKLNYMCRRIKNHGSIVRHDHELIGRNSRLDNFQAVAILEKFKYLNLHIKKKNFLAKIYLKNLFSQKNNILLPNIKKDEVHSFHQFVVYCKHRNKLKKYLKNKGVETLIHYPRMLSDLKIFDKNKSSSSIKIAKNLGDKILSLPISHEHTREEIRYVCSKINEFYNKKIFKKKII
ncbi:DegT/DnrJ/EryC1/StrS family aminotransferase [Candidatus Pelagibacter sp.]|uniref:DegT/DnrJ/EryC1/StrS family aminotransferase n=1 Tax=Candidatus Pelagibacter sp. TaxID=2024849 RepID=UPI003F84916E